MRKTSEPAYITAARRELAKCQRNSKFLASQYKQYKARKSDLARPFKVMAKLALSHVRQVKGYILKAVTIQERIDELSLQIADLESRRQLLSKDSAHT
jgi:hypothetical protein